jgi:NAD+ synthase
MTHSSSPALTIALAQATQSVGDLRGNADAMLEWRARAVAQGADLILFPELQLIGYPPEDLVLKPAMVERAGEELLRLMQATGDGGPAMLVGTVIANQGALFNCVALLDGGEIKAVRQKRELPNYGTFDEKRLFAPGPLPEPIEFRGVKMLGLPVCEDVWHPDRLPPPETSAARRYCSSASTAALTRSTRTCCGSAQIARRRA